MAVAAAVIEQGEGRTTRVTWAAMAAGDTGDPISLPGAPDATVQVVGTFSGSTVTLEGSLEKTPVNWFPLSNQADSNIAFTAPGGEFIQQVVTWIRPSAAGGTGTGLIVTLLARAV